MMNRIEQKPNTITIICYRKVETYPEGKRSELIKLYAEGVQECMGSEAERYGNILAGLIDGQTLIFDDVWDEEQYYKKYGDN